ncbi:MAG TPA: SDR family NAD(P)-dependent oxidoreductase [Alphaproteobacteria bacterium]|jgi:NAD(P)-dependent dehydrogenase (short-subunit alcohol dehydrogenase family)|nr:SDR family NAD(P)-dependent oxidoreductase [Alphaproteobacteria bacterium]
MSGSFDLSSKAALITGGNSGIGLAMAEALAEAGASVAIWGSNPNKTAAAAETLKVHGGQVLAQICDVTDEAASEDAFAAAVAEFGGIDACFANAGVSGRGGPFIEMTTEEWHRVLAVNLDGAFYTLRAAARHMVERGKGGSLVGTASLAAIHGQARGQHYGASKGAMISMIRALAVELGRYKIRANAILPGWIKTAMTRNWMAQEVVQDRVLKRVPTRRWGQPEDFSAIAVYLTADASQYHTGDTFLIDGAYSLF